MLRKIEERFFKIVMFLSLSIVLLALVSIISVIFIKGIPLMNLDMVIKTPEGGFYLGKKGGILNAIIGSFYLASGSCIASLILSLPIVFYLNIVLKKKSNFSNFIRFFLDVLCGVPSIVYGAFGLTIMYFFKLRASLLGGIITLSILILPVMIRALDELVQIIPQGLNESAYALGSNKYELSFKILLKQILPGIITTLLICFGRAIGDSASVLFTAGFSDYIPYSLFRPAASIPLSIFFQLTSPIPDVQNRAYAAAFILTLLILVISITSRLIAARLNKFTIK